MNEGKILLVNLSKGLLGEANSQFLGLILMGKINAELMKRAAMPPTSRRPFYLYVDEFQSLTTENFSILMSEARKYGLSLVLANQYLDQIRENHILQSIFGNVGALISFRVGHEDAERLKMHFQPAFNAYDLINLPNYQACVKFSNVKESSSQFTMNTVLQKFNPNEAQRRAIIQSSQFHYGKSRSMVEGLIRASLNYENSHIEDSPYCQLNLEGQ